MLKSIKLVTDFKLFTKIVYHSLLRLFLTDFCYAQFVLPVPQFVFAKLVA